MSRERLIRASEMVAWLAAMIIFTISVTSWQRVMDDAPPDVAQAIAAIPNAPSMTADSLSARAERVAANDPFRLARRPSPVAYRPELEGAPAPPPAPPKPPLSVSGIIGGPPWQAVLEGIPGHEGPLVVRTGDRVGDLVVRAVRRDTVVIVSPDTAWKLTVRRPWK